MTVIKALSFTQPWATLVAIGAKHVETRSWATTYRGLLAIHAAKAFPRDAIELCLEQPFARLLYAAGIRQPADLPRGAVVAVARLTDCRSTTPDMIERSWVAELSDIEDALGDFTPGRFGWSLDDVRPCDPPVPVRGALGLWDWEAPF